MHKKLIPSPSDVDYVIYHANCSDGFGARFAAELLLGARATYFAAKYGEPPPNVSGKNVVIVDFSYDNVTTKRMIEEANTLIILDHHRTALVELSDIPNVRFDMDKSGAILSWEFFHPGQQPPRFLEYIQDRDLWRWKLPCSKEFASVFDMVDFSYEEYEKFLIDSVVDETQERGAHIIAYSKTVISKIAKGAASRRIDRQHVLVVNSPHWISEIGAALALHADYALVWYWDHSTNQVRGSLRAHHEHSDVSEVAKKWGGGGHRKAAGFSLPPGVGIETIFDAESSD
jgi:oligoribonuclease NrnB/cAMP/cGMP phosphodiesterase (DHH superfamily)